MKLFTNRKGFESALRGIRKWDRTLEALDTLSARPYLDENVMYSIGDSLTYRKIRGDQIADSRFTGHRRYQEVIFSANGGCSVLVAPKHNLNREIEYSDLTDREQFSGDGVGEVIQVPQGGILIIDIDEGYRIVATPDSSLVELHVTVEGAFFHNK